jgi:tol-pal system protein YbgF
MMLRMNDSLLSKSKLLAQVSIALTAFFALNFAHAGLFDDEEARKAILELRGKVDQNARAAEAQDAQLKFAQDAQLKAAEENNAALRRSLLDLQGQIEALRVELARLRGQDEQLARDVAEMQRRQKDMAQAVDDRVRRFEPTKVTVDGREFNAEPAEKRDFDAAFALFRKPDYPAATGAFIDFTRRYPQSGYQPSALFWLGNAQYASRDYNGAITNFRSLIATASDHPKAPEAALGLANSQIELKAIPAARKTLEDLIKVYPQSEAAVAAKDRLSKLR